MHIPLDALFEKDTRIINHLILSNDIFDVLGIVFKDKPKVFLPAPS